MKNLFLILFILCFQASSQSFAALSWEFAGWHAGGCFPNVEFDPHVKNRVYLTSDVAGLWRSDDGGENWHFKTRGLGHLIVAQIAIAPSDSNVLYAATGGGVFVSRDAAESWTAAGNPEKLLKFVRPASYRPVAVDPNNPGRLCAGTNKGRVFCSENFGKTWHKLDLSKQASVESKPISALAFNQDGTVLFVASSSGLIRCLTDENVCVNLPDGPRKVTDAIFSTKTSRLYAAGEAAIWVSNDQGQSWQVTEPVTRGTTFRVALDESVEPPILRVVWNKSWDGGVLESRDNGVTWTSQDAQITVDLVSDPSRSWARKGGRTTALKIDPFNPAVIFRTDWWGVFRSDDAGTSWQEKIIGTPNTVATDLAFTPDGNVLVASMDNGLLLSRNQGKTYEPLFPVKGYDPWRNGHVWRVVSSQDTIIATSSPWEKKINQVIISNDGGATFELVQQGLPEKRPVKNTMWGEGFPRALAVDPNNPDVVYLGIDGDDGGGLFISRDRAKTWQRSPGQPDSLRIFRGLAIDPSDSKRIVWGANGKLGGVYVSSDGGQSFSWALRKMSWVFDIAIDPKGVIYAAGDQEGAKLYVSRNHGRAWKVLKDFGKGRALASVAVDPSNPQRIAASTVSWSNEAPSRIYLSTDAGRSFKDVTSDLPDGAGASSIVFDPNGKYLYITRYAGSVYRLALE